MIPITDHHRFYITVPLCFSIIRHIANVGMSLPLTFISQITMNERVYQCWEQYSKEKDTQKSLSTLSEAIPIVTTSGKFILRECLLGPLLKTAVFYQMFYEQSLTFGSLWCMNGGLILGKGNQMC